MEKIKFLVIGWDGADWKVINRLVEEGKMPTLAKLIEEGTIGNISTLDPPFSPMLWTSIATGKLPFKHGVLGFTEPMPNMQGIRPITSLSRKTKAIWNILTQEGYFCNVVNWWPSHPAEPINGFMVSNFYKAIKDPHSQQLPSGAVHPAEFSEFFNHLRLSVTEITGQMLIRFVPNIEDVLKNKPRALNGIIENLATTLSVHNAATWLLENTSWDFMAVYYDMIDHMSHGFMKYYPPKLPSVSDEDFEYFKNVVEATYIMHDYMLGAMLSSLDNDVNLILLSDHGFHSDHLRPGFVLTEPAGPAYEHRQLGILLLKGPLFKKDERIYGASLLDITPTILYGLDLPIGKDMDGTPLVTAFNEVHEIQTIQSWDKVEGESGMRKIDDAKNYDYSEALEQLIELGYIEVPDPDKFKAAKRSQTELNYNLARSYMFAKMYRKALPLLKALVEEQPSEGRFVLRLVSCYIALGRNELAKEMLENFLELLNKQRQELQQKEKELDANKPETKDSENKIFEQRKRILKIEKNLVLAKIKLAEILTQEKQYQKAEEIVEELSKRVKPDPNFYVKVAQIYEEQGKLLSAVSYLHKASQLNPEDYLVLQSLARVYYKLENWDLAANYALESLGLVYYNYAAHYILGLAMNKLGEYERAAMALEVCLTIVPNFDKARNLLIEIYEKHLGNLEKAELHRKYLSKPKEFVDELNRSLINERGDFRVQPQKGILKQKTQQDVSAKAPVIVVSGIPRSGTSLLMQMLKNAGFELFIDDKRKSDVNNPRGYYEHEAVKRIMQDNSFLDQLPGKAVKIVSHLLPFLSPKHSYKVIFVTRNLDEIIHSQLKMIKNLTQKDKTYRVESLRRSLTAHLRQIKAWLIQQSNIDTLYVDYNQLLKNPSPIIEQIADFLNIDREAQKKMQQSIDKRLYRTKLKNNKN